jgi:hypothetical protein
MSSNCRLQLVPEDSNVSACQPDITKFIYDLNCQGKLQLVCVNIFTAFGSVFFLCLSRPVRQLGCPLSKFKPFHPVRLKGTSLPPLTPQFGQ